MWYRTRRFQQFLLVVAAPAAPAHLWWLWCGDAIIHLRFIETGARGEWFTYNANEISAGTTSLGWTYLFALFLRASNWSIMLLCQKLLLMACMMALPLMVFNAARSVTNKGIIPLLLGLACALHPGTLYNGP